MWYFVSPQIVFGDDALEALDDLQGQRAFIVTDETLVELGLVDRVARHLHKAALTVEVFDGVEADPSLRTVREGAAVAREFAPDWIVGVGGGSSMDAAKAIWVLYERPDLAAEEITPFAELGLRQKARLITVPTTSGTGAEVTWPIVLTDTEAQRKMSLGNRENVADLAVVDPDMVMGMPPRLTADTGLDALTHAIEGYTCTWHTDMTDGLCVDALRKIITYLPRAYADGSDREARTKMHNAATLAGLGFGNSLASMAHATGHALGALFHIPHGRAVGTLLPYTIEFVARQAPARFAELAHVLGCDAEDDAGAARTLADRIRTFVHALGNPVSVAEMGVDRAAFDTHVEALVEKAFTDGSLVASARTPNVDELRRFFAYAYEGKSIDF
ncbi:MAG: iron-containing alcohol dehydrogenase [Anaerolineae bacterium]